LRRQRYLVNGREELGLVSERPGDIHAFIISCVELTVDMYETT
jgi:hypothetical protein